MLPFFFFFPRRSILDTLRRIYLIVISKFWNCPPPFFCLVSLVCLCFIIGFAPDSRCCFSLEDYFNLYTCEVWSCNIRLSGSWLEFLVCLFASRVVIAHVSSAALYGESIYFTLDFCPLFSGISNHLCTSKSLLSRFVGEKKVLCRRPFLFPFLMIFAEEVWCWECILPWAVALSLGWLRHNLSISLLNIFLCDCTRTEFEKMFCCWWGFSNPFS